MPSNIILIGFMGSGKSSIGRRIASLNGFRFTDTDDLVVEKAGMPITEIFSKYGEEHFRDLETEVLQGLESSTGIVLATGGGLALREQNRPLLKRVGRVVWLDAAPDTLFERVSRNNRRPLLQTDNPRETFDTLLAFRNSIYEALCDIRIDSTTLNHERTAHAVLDSLAKIEE
ncbi:MAG: shikimate kinase [Chthoniobacterales bacterium]